MTFTEVEYMVLVANSDIKGSDFLRIHNNQVEAGLTDYQLFIGGRRMVGIPIEFFYGEGCFDDATETPCKCSCRSACAFKPESERTDIFCPNPDTQIQRATVCWNHGSIEANGTLSREEKDLIIDYITSGLCVRRRNENAYEEEDDACSVLSENGIAQFIQEKDDEDFGNENPSPRPEGGSFSPEWTPSSFTRDEEIGGGQAQLADLAGVLELDPLVLAELSAARKRVREAEANVSELKRQLVDSEQQLFEAKSDLETIKAQVVRALVQ